MKGHIPHYNSIKRGQARKEVIEALCMQPACYDLIKKNCPSYICQLVSCATQAISTAMEKHNFQVLFYHNFLQFCLLSPLALIIHFMYVIRKKLFAV